MKALSKFSPRLLASFLMLGVAINAYADEAGLLLAQKLYNRPDGKDSTALLSMTLTESGRSPRIRQLVTYHMRTKPGEQATLTRFLEPADIEGTGLLTLDHVEAESDQWIYLPALEKVRRISASRKGGRFVNSEIFYEDLRDRKPQQDNHRIIGRETINGIACEVLESIPVEASNSVYLKRVSWIDPQTLLALRVDYFEKNLGEPSKRVIAKKHGKVQGYWVVLDSLTTELSSNNQTRLTINKILFDRRLPAKLFTTQTLEDEDKEQEFRP